jgi:hypothetical protein
MKYLKKHRDETQKQKIWFYLRFCFSLDIDIHNSNKDFSSYCYQNSKNFNFYLFKKHFLDNS